MTAVIPHSSARNPLAHDLDEILLQTRELWDNLRGERLFITGGTGFVGCWLLETFAWANDRLQLGATAHVLTRNAAAFREKAPHLASHSSIHLHAGDVCSFEYPQGSFGHVVHAAADTRAAHTEGAALRVLETTLHGTRRTLDFARHAGVRRFLLVSSGAVYGRQPPELTLVPEEYAGAPDPSDAQAAYGEAKRLAELLCHSYGEELGIPAVIARCFAFLGPYLPLDSQFAAGNFVRDVLHARDVALSGDGTTIRSYLYAGDLAVWLWTILFRGKVGRPYNVGSEKPVSIWELANFAASLGSPRPLAACRAVEPIPGRIPDRYVPSVRRAREELGLSESLDLVEGLRRTLAWEQRRRRS
jgi:dTDP-glucose 4,6-dehydratase